MTSKPTYGGFIYLDGDMITHKRKQALFCLVEGLRAGISVYLPRDGMRHDGYASWAICGEVFHWYAVKTRCTVPYSRWKKLYAELEKLAKKHGAKKMEILVLPIGVKNHLPDRLRKWGWTEAKQTLTDRALRRKRFEKIL